jgi:pyruvate/2-oxoglutarate dehydrogenase complex dihydrolipoamide acyltransferase (E2) component
MSPNLIPPFGYDRARMATPVTVPRLGDEMESGTLIRFLVAEGSEVQRGDPLFELDTDKVTQEVEAEADGVLLRVDAADGGEYPVGATLAWIGAPGEQLPERGG